MTIEQIYTGCLAQGAYYIASEGEALIIDPLREVQPYIDRATKAGDTIKYILETHFHADFVSGHVELAQKTGATIVYGPTAAPEFKAHIAAHGERLALGKVAIEVLHTPGHTMESTTYLLRNAEDQPVALFTGDTLFIGDVGRPDLAVKTDLTQEDLASHLFDSLRNAILPLPDDVIVYPGHGAGSACGKNMSKETFDTLGNQRKVNYALRADMTREEFIKEVTDGLLPPPQYFPKNAVLNKQGAAPIDEVYRQAHRSLAPEAFEAMVQETEALVLDTRDPQDFARMHVPGSINIGIDGNFAVFVGTLIHDLHQPLAIVAPRGREHEVITRLARVGYDNTLGYLEGGLEAWARAGMEIDQVESISAHEFEMRLVDEPHPVIDVRKPGEYDSEHLVDAENIPLDYLNDHMARFDSNATYYLHCAGGYRSMIAASILKARGIHNLIDVKGGFGMIKHTQLPRTAYVCPTTL
jgi:glyoxylase-like metal-dependent hydrolase (beta-lactamase superfamily II)/rhodanese-related sulfurtransferase